MIRLLDLASLAGLREGNRLEFKSAVGGLPNSLWETYSAFANTDGGVIVLGVREEKDGMPVPSGLKNPETVRKQLWDVLNNRKKTSANILVDSDVVADMFEEHPVIVVTVPRASRDDRPVFINNDMFGGSYRRNGEGDYHCTRFDVTAMVRDSYPSNSDKRVLDGISLSALSGETIKAYRNQFDNMRPRHPWSPLSDEEFLLRLGAVGRSREDGELHPTHAGLLMFGEAWSITDEYPDFFLDCRQVTEGRRWDNRITSASGEWSGNVFEFFNRAYRMLVEELPVPFELDANMRRVDDTLQHKAVREALANALVHTDYYGRAGVVAIRYPDRVEVANPGLLRTPADVIRAGGVSDPRNGTLATMFNLLSIGEKAGSGFDVLRQAAASVGKPEPELRELYDPERVYLTLHLETNGLALGTRHKDDASQETASGGRAVASDDER
ncbi:MAG: putative DNA binding domain-containing protein [Coriobacteriales bacterium]|nr:putative DNA binding domain-containing protein [Coriobacteriales bacterium]